MLPYAVGQLGSLSFCFLLHCLFFTFSLSVFILFSSSLVLYYVYSRLKTNSSLATRFLFCFCWIACCCSLGVPCLCIINSGSQGVATYPLANCTIFFFIGLVFWLYCHMTHLPSQHQIRLQNSFMTRLNPSLNPVPPLGAISAIRSGAPRSYDIHSFHAVDLLNH